MAIFGRHPWSALRQPSFIASDHRTSPVLGLHISGNRVNQELTRPFNNAFSKSADP